MYKYISINKFQTNSSFQYIISHMKMKIVTRFTRYSIRLSLVSCANFVEIRFHRLTPGTTAGSIRLHVLAIKTPTHTFSQLFVFFCLFAILDSINISSNAHAHTYTKAYRVSIRANYIMSTQNICCHFINSAFAFLALGI